MRKGKDKKFSKGCSLCSLLHFYFKINHLTSEQNFQTVHFFSEHIKRGFRPLTRFITLFITAEFSLEFFRIFENNVCNISAISLFSAVFVDIVMLR